MLDNLSEWGKGYPGFLRETAKYLATIPYTYKNGENSRNDQIDINPSLYPPIREWLGYYRNTKAIIPAILQMAFSEINEKDPLQAEVISMLKTAAIQNDISAVEIANHLGFYDSETTTAIGKIVFGDKSDFLENDRDPISEEFFIDNPELIFFCKVFLPCLVFYYDLPLFVYRKARSGHVDSICKLLQLDTRVMADERIADSIHKASLKRESKEFKKIIQSLSGPKKYRTTKKIKIHVASIIYWIFQLCDIELKTPEIQRLLDATHAHFCPDEMIDPDLPEMPHTFYMDIRNKKPFRLPRIQPQKK